jgi:hypothetical protein
MDEEESKERAEKINGRHWGGIKNACRFIQLI